MYLTSLWELSYNSISETNGAQGSPPRSLGQLRRYSTFDQELLAVYSCQTIPPLCWRLNVSHPHWSQAPGVSSLLTLRLLHPMTGLPSGLHFTVHHWHQTVDPNLFPSCSFQFTPLICSSWHSSNSTSHYCSVRWISHGFFVQCVHHMIAVHAVPTPCWGWF